MLWLFDSARATTACITDYESLIRTLRFYDDSEWTGRFPLSDYAALSAARYAVVGGEDEVYLVEWVKIVTEGLKRYVEAGGNSATSMLKLRTLEGTFAWTNAYHGAIVSDIIGSFTGDRALPLVFGTGDTLGTQIDLQRSWGDASETVREILSSAELGMRCHLSGTDIVVDVYAPTTQDYLLGEKHGDGNGASLLDDIREWRNYAIVLGEVPATVTHTYSASTLVYGSASTGTIANTRSTNGTYYTIAESATNGLTLEVVFQCGSDGESGTLVVDGYYAGTTGHQIDLLAYNYDTSTFDTTCAAFMPNETTSARQTCVLGDAYVSDAGEVKIRLKHNTTTYNANHKLYLDYVAFIEQPERVRVDVDLTGSNDLRELYVDARDLQSTTSSGTLTAAAYRARLTARGKEKLAETRRVAYAEADVQRVLAVGDIVWYDSGLFSASLMCSEKVITTESGATSAVNTLGDPPPSLRRSIKRGVDRWRVNG